MSATAEAGLNIDRRVTGDGSQRLVLRESYDARRQRIDLMNADATQVTARLSLFDPERGELTVFDEAAKRGFVTPLRSLGAKRPKSDETAVTFARTGTKKVGKWTCTTYRVTQAERTLGETCTVPLESLGLSPTDLGAFGQVPDLGTGTSARWTTDLRFGFPVDVVAYAGQGLPASHLEVLAVKKVASFAPKHFAWPTGFRRAEAPPVSGSVPSPDSPAARVKK